MDTLVPADPTTWPLARSQGKWAGPQCRQAFGSEQGNGGRPNLKRFRPPRLPRHARNLRRNISGPRITSR